MNNTSKYLSDYLLEICKTLFDEAIVENNKHLLEVTYFAKFNIDYICVGLNNMTKILKNISIDELGRSILENVKLSDIKCTFTRNNLNFFLTTNYLNKQINYSLSCSNLIKYNPTSENILVDFSSPNIAKDMHVGHL